LAPSRCTWKPTVSKHCRRFPAPEKPVAKGNGWVIETDDVMDAMQHILHTASEHGVEIEALEMVRPSLESVFLSLTGTSLRD
jgi:ABC-2 type transport system ATP-binding protein